MWTEHPDTPAGRAAAWLVGVLAGEVTLDDAAVTEGFAPSFLRAIPAPRLLEMLSGLTDALRPAEPFKVRELSPTSLAVGLRTAEGDARLSVVVEDDEPHRIVGAQVQPIEAGARPWSSIPTPPADGPAIPLERLRAQQELVGIGGALFGAEGVEWVGGVGPADIDAGIDIDESTVFRIGSVTKTMTAYAVLQLVEDGLVSLDDPIDGLVPDVDVPGVVTVRHALTHTSGLDSDASPGAADDEPKPSVPELLRAHPLRCAFEPGSQRAYSNVAFALLGHVVSVVRAAPLDAVVRDRLFRPLGMLDTSYVLDADLRTRLAVGYESVLGDVAPVPWFDIVMPGAGSVFSTLADVTRYGQAVLARAVPGVSADLVEQSLRLQAGDNGFGWNVALAGVDGRHAWHNGGWPGFSTMLFLDLDRSRGALTWTNTTSASIEAPTARWRSDVD